MSGASSAGGHPPVKRLGSFVQTVFKVRPDAAVKGTTTDGREEEEEEKREKRRRTQTCDRKRKSRRGNEYLGKQTYNYFEKWYDLTGPLDTSWCQRPFFPRSSSVASYTANQPCH